MKDIIGNKKIIILGLGHQGGKVIDFFIKHGCRENLIGICKSNDTKKNREKKYAIPVVQEYKNLLDRYQGDISFIYIAIKPERIQQQVYLDIYHHFPELKILIEKSYIGNDSLEKLLHTPIHHMIVQNELWSTAFFEHIKKIPQKEIKNIQILISPGSDVFKNIRQQQVYFLSYIFEYISFLPCQSIEIHETKKSEDRYIFSVHIDSIPLEIILEDTQKNHSNDTAIYSCYNEEKMIFRRNSQFSFIGSRAIVNIGKETSYFEQFLYKNIPLLLQKETHLAEQIEIIKKFRKHNTSFQTALNTTMNQR